MGVSLAERKKQTRVVVLAGAGASKAVQPEKFPTTVEFFKRLPPPVVSDGYFQFVLGFLQAQRGDAVIDIEVVLWELQKLIEFFQQVSDKSSIVGSAIATNLMKTVNAGWNFGHLGNGGPQLTRYLENTIGLVNQQVYELYSYDPEPNELKNNWSPLIYRLLEFGAHLDIFTTNYDLVIENALQELDGDEFMFKYSGATGRVQKFLNLGQWQEDASRSGGLLTKLHGSLNWKVSGDRIAIGDSAFTGTHAKHAIIYPGFKGRSNAAFFEPFHDYFSRMLASADHVLIVGFAFRDEYISQILRTSLAPAATVTVVDPEKSVKFPTNRKVNRIGKGFDRESVNAFLSTVGALVS
jgi:hypothetical protein